MKQEKVQGDKLRTARVSSLSMVSPWRRSIEPALLIFFPPSALLCAPPWPLRTVYRFSVLCSSMWGPCEKRRGCRGEAQARRVQQVQNKQGATRCRPKSNFAHETTALRPLDSFQRSKPLEIKIV